MYKIERASISDLQEIHDLLFEYFKEIKSPNLTWDEESAKNQIINLDLPLVAKDNYGTIVGIASLVVHKTWYKEPVAFLEGFYVTPKWRGTGLSRDLVSTIVQIADASGAAAFYANSITGKNGSLFSNLFKKYGFKETGMELVRER